MAISFGPSAVGREDLLYDVTPVSSTGKVGITSPTDISGCVLWLDAADATTITSSSNLVSAWDDKSDTGLTLTSPASTYYPTLVSNAVNGKSAIYFDTTNKVLKSSWNTALSDFTMIKVFNGWASHVSDNYRYLLTFYKDASNRFYVDLNDPDGSNANKSIWYYWNGGGSPKLSLGLPDSITVSEFMRGNPNILTFINSGSNNTFFSNGNSRTVTTSGSQAVDIATGSTLYIGNRQDWTAGTVGLGGYVCEVIIFNKALSLTERIQIEKYLAIKWRIPYNADKLLEQRNNIEATTTVNPVFFDQSIRHNPDLSLNPQFYISPQSSLKDSNIDVTNLTMSAWVKPYTYTSYGTTNDRSTILTARSGFGYLTLTNSTGRIACYMYGSGGNTGSHRDASSSPNLNEWSHISWTYDGSTIRFYLNGSAVGTASASVGTLTFRSNNIVAIGAEQNSYRVYDGEIGHQKIWKKTLSAAEIVEDYNSNKSLYQNQPGIVTSNLYFYVDADKYSSTYSSSNWKDLSGNANDATSTNTASLIGYGPKAFDFDGTDDAFDLPVRTVDSQIAWSISFWVNFDTWITSNSGYGNIYAEEQGVWIANYYDKIGIDFGNGYWIDGNGGNTDGLQITVPSSQQTDTWLHVAWTFQGSSSSPSATITGYLNGSQNVQVTTSFSTGVAAMYSSSSVSYRGGIGYRRSYSGYYFDGKIASMLIYRKTLSAAEVLQNYNADKYKFGL